MGRQAQAELGVAALVAAAVVGYATIDDAVVTSILYVSVLCGASVVAWVGAERAPEGHRLVGRLIAAGLSMTAVGDLIWEVLDLTGRVTDVSVADPWWFASYLAIGAALWVVLRRGTEDSRDELTFLIDAATIVVVSVLVFWNVSINSIAADHTLAPYVRIVWAAYPVADAILLALVVRVMMSRRARTALDPSFALGICIWLAADIAYLLSPDGAFQVLMDAGWMIAPVLLARTVWRTGRRTDAVPPLPALPGSVSQLVIAICPLLVPPALELVADLRGKPDQPVLLIVGSVALTLLAFVRTARLMRSEEQALRELETARDAALEASRAKSMFLATMSHEIRTPLTLVLGAGEVLEDTPLDELQLSLVRRMRRSGDLLRGLVDGILDFSRIEAGQLELASKEFDLHDVVDDVVEVYLARASGSGITFEHRVDPDVPRAVVGDPDRVVQVLSNLLDNAMKFTHDGCVRLEVRSSATARWDAAGAHWSGVEIVVSDTGIGIGPEDLPTVFESFRQVDGSTTRRYGGTGLGLAICKELVELMGGGITVTSDLGRGSVFVARVPLGEAAGARTGAGPADGEAPALSPAGRTH